MRIGIDFDDTLCDFTAMLQREALRRWDADLPALRAAGIKPHEHLGEGWTALVRELLETDLALQMPVKPGASEVTARLAAHHDLVLLTARHEHETAFARQWIAANGLPISDVQFTSRAPKDTAARELGLRVHLDDTASVFDTFVDHPTASALLVGSIFDRGDAPGAHVRSVEHWHAFEDLVSTLDERRD